MEFQRRDLFMTIHARVTTALLLVAGMGSRLRPFTFDAPKCLTEVGGVPILERLVCNLRDQGIERLVVVIGHMSAHIRNFLASRAGDMQVDYIYSPDYRTTNNIYSLWLAREQIQEPFLLVESDLLFDASMLTEMLQPDKIAVSLIRPWMNGTTVTVDPGQRVTAFHVGGVKGDMPHYKTVNIYCLSPPIWNEIIKRMARYISEGRVNEFYEAVFADMVADGMLSLETVFFDPDSWYEIDTIADLREAERMFGKLSRAHTGPDVHGNQKLVAVRSGK
jgi:NDP-sugar pyrophosphorylase family protein